MPTQPPAHAVQVLRAESVLSALPDGDLDRLLAGLAWRSYRRGDVLFQQGDPADMIWLLSGGWVRLYRLTRDGEHKVLWYRTRGQTVGEIGVSHINGHNTVAEVYDDSSAFLMPRSEWLAQLERHPPVLRALLGVLTAERRQLEADMVDLSISDTRRRLISTLVTLGERYGRLQDDGTLRLALPMTQHELAAIIGSSRETVSRLCGGLPSVRIEQRALSILHWEEFQALNG